MLQAQNGRLTIDGATMDYIRFGSGSRSLVMIPGVGDGLKTVKCMALPFAWMYRALAKDFTVTVFSRRNELVPGTGTREMAADLSRAFEQLNLRGAAVVGVSQGGMIAQWLAIDHPELVRKLVLTVTLSRSNPTAEDVIGRWLKMAENGDYRGIMLDTAERSYSPKRIAQARKTYGLLGNLGKPKSFDRFRIQAESCLTHNAWEALPRIACPTLVIGGEEDRIVTGEASREIAARIPGSELVMVPGLGHGLYEEDPEFLKRVIAFCQ
ncbi:MAG: alpha/beta hydrolase [Clostridia bacterium]|nr:alpha/beta hydrolase [Clostridia bacterium]